MFIGFSLQEYDSLLRRHCIENLASASASLFSLSQLLERISNIVINDDIAKQVWSTIVHHITKKKKIIAAFIMRTYPSSEDVQGATYYYYPGCWIQIQDCTYSAQFPLSREHSLPSCLLWHYRQIHTQHILHILLGTHLYTWVESSNVDKVSC